MLGMDKCSHSFLGLQVNADLAARAMLGTDGADADGAAPGKKSRKPAGDLLGDDRFKALFEDTAFTIDEQSEEYKALHPNTGKLELHTPYLDCILSSSGELWCLIAARDPALTEMYEQDSAGFTGR